MTECYFSAARNLSGNFDSEGEEALELADSWLLRTGWQSGVATFPVPKKVRLSDRELRLMLHCCLNRVTLSAEVENFKGRFIRTLTNILYKQVGLIVVSKEYKWSGFNEISIP